MVTIVHLMVHEEAFGLELFILWIHVADGCTVQCTTVRATERLMNTKSGLYWK